jgi:hypothetical protein
LGRSFGNLAWNGGRYVIGRWFAKPDSGTLPGRTRCTASSGGSRSARRLA